ncbi:hypothetical protein JG688_00015103 [Phytophthora aleatoria]|uniref:Uncharacterized protein n=1 Tax=Phytophthora aleatoria TaxID=2496075 RepID=A0A8J5I6F4_9STRA|nr:hypothetical protein JG688_00015103 [Phytophthora aleatoria]
MECIMKESGGNEYKLPHMGKAKLRTEGSYRRVFHVIARFTLVLLPSSRRQVGLSCSRDNISMSK